MDAKITWKGRMSFEGQAFTSNFSLPLGTEPEVGGDADGFRPLELFLLGLAGCTGMDVISILQKKRQDVTAFEVKVHADREAEHPRVFKDIVVEYVVTGRGIDPAAVERAVELSETKYCPAQAMLGKAASISHIITLQEA